MKKETYAYPSTMARLKAEYKIFILAFVFIVIADSIGQIQVPLGPGTLILFPIFYSLIMGVISGPRSAIWEPFFWPFPLPCSWA